MKSASSMNCMDAECASWLLNALLKSAKSLLIAALSASWESAGFAQVAASGNETNSKSDNRAFARGNVMDDSSFGWIPDGGDAITAVFLASSGREAGRTWP